MNPVGQSTGGSTIRRSSGGWARVVAVLIGALYLAVLTVGWIATNPAGHEGIVRTHEPELAPDGLVIGEVAAGTPADRAGLRPGDVILAVDGVPASDGEALHELYHRQRAGDPTTLRVRRASAGEDGPSEDLSFTLLSRLEIPSILLDLLIRSVVGLLSVAVAVGVVLARPHDLAARLLLVFGSSFALLPMSDVWHWGLPAPWLAELFDRVSTVSTALGWTALLHLFLAFPVPQPPLGRLRALGPPALRRFGGGIVLLYALPLATPLALAVGLLHPHDSPELWDPIIALAGFLLLLGVLVAALVALLSSYRQAQTALARAQLRWILWSLAVGVAAVLLALIAPVATGGRVQSMVPTLAAAAWVLFPISIGIAILRYRLWDIEILINRTLIYGALTASVVGIYVLAVGSLGLLFQTSGNLVTSLLATGLVAVLFQPLRERLQRGVNRLLYGERDDPYAVLSRLGQRLEATLAPDAILPAIVQTVREALKLPYAAIAIKHDETFAVAAASGAPVDTPLCLPLVYQHEPVGQLMLAPRRPGEAFGPADRRLLEDLARQAGAAVHAIRLTADLQRARERLVTAREEERRRLRRDLHDGLGPALAALTLKVGSARSLLARDPAAADARLAELEADLDAALADVRRLVYNLRPPTLDELGLVGAIRESAARYCSGPASATGFGGADWLRIEVDAPDRLPPLPAAVEVAAYRIAQEALTNVVRHARARKCTVRLALSSSALDVEIVDDGVGLTGVHRAGVGLASMSERAAELGGTCVVEGLPAGGTRVLARLPLSSVSPELAIDGAPTSESDRPAPDAVGGRA